MSKLKVIRVVDFRQQHRRALRWFSCCVRKELKHVRGLTKPDNNTGEHRAGLVTVFEKELKLTKPDNNTGEHRAGLVSPL
jgi:hypothetical protein